LVVAQRQTLKAAAAAFSVCPKTAHKWVVRHRTEGAAGLRDRTSRPAHSTRRIAESRRHEVWRLREQGLTYAEIGAHAGLS
jgi:transposase-like protein